MLSREELRSLLLSLSPPPHREAKRLREIEALCIKHCDPATAAGAGLAERRAYNRARHAKPRHVDSMPCIRLQDLLRASQLEAPLASWLRERPGEFRGRLRDAMQRVGVENDRVEEREEALALRAA